MTSTASLVCVWLAAVSCVAACAGPQSVVVHGVRFDKPRGWSVQWESDSTVVFGPPGDSTSALRVSALIAQTDLHQCPGAAHSTVEGLPHSRDYQAVDLDSATSVGASDTLFQESGQLVRVHHGYWVHAVCPDTVVTAVFSLAQAVQGAGVGSRNGYDSSAEVLVRSARFRGSR